MQPKSTPEQRFWKYVTPGPIDECWEWHGSKFSNGYGSLQTRGRNYLAHRLSYEIHHGPIPKGQLVCHRCDNRICVNPNHLFVGTHTENMRDMADKGRRGYYGSPGETHPGSKVTEKDVVEIRALWAQGVSQTEIAKRYGLVKQQINNIVHRKSWAHVT